MTAPKLTGDSAIAHPLDGNLRGIKPSLKKALERTYRRKSAPDEVVSPELARHLSDVSRQLGRQVGVLIDRGGTVKRVIVGDATRLELPDIGRLRGGVGRFRGLRLVHTHLRGEPLTADDLNDLALLRLDAVAMVAVEGDGNGAPGGKAGKGGKGGKRGKGGNAAVRDGAVEVAMIAPEALVEEEEGDETGAGEPWRRIRARDVFHLDLDFEAEIRALEEELSRLARGGAGRTDRERALVIATSPDDARLEETLELVRASGVELAGTVRQKRFRVHPKTVVGRGKLLDIILESMKRRAEVAIFDIDLKPAQARAFEDATGLKAIDRTQLILDIFAQRATSNEGKLQVELAQLKYSLPRLTEKDAGLSRLTGGIGGRGPGETVMEIGRRRIRDRIRALEKQIERLSMQRALRRRRRSDGEIPVLSIVGYTNAGKSTLLNVLTNSEVEAADQLFMTLDPTSRRLRFPREGEVIVTDTVGFISELPSDLIAAFRATLEELADADLLLHVVDAADPAMESKKEAVERLLDDLELGEIPRLVVLNKADRLAGGTGGAEAQAMARRHDGVAISALDRATLPPLIAAAEEALGARSPFIVEHPAPAPA